MSTTTARGGGPREVLKRLLVGRPVSSYRLEHTLLPKILALPVFSSDALSSVAYATEEILAVLLAASTGTHHYVMPIAIAISLLMAIVVASYRQTVRAYPSGGGAYIVSRENLGVGFGLVAAAALLVDYVMTVVVSVVAGVFAIVSAAPGLSGHKVALSIAFVVFITFANLRGVRESGTLFAVPTYAFIVSILVMVTVGLFRCFTGGCPVAVQDIAPKADLATGAGAVGLFVILRAFSSGSTALTGVEAISNGVPAFRKPQAKNAAGTLGIMGVISITMFLGISYLATRIQGITVSDERSVVGQIAHAVFGGGFLFYVVQAFTAAILVLAANTAYQDFPRLSSILARDRFMPRQFQNRGDRLVFSNGVIGLGLIACVVIYAFNADLTRLIQLYVVGVFTSFTLSQSGMVRHWLKEKAKGEAGDHAWRHAIVINAIGAITTGVVLVVVTYTKFGHGAWLSITAMIVLVPTFRSIHRHYAGVMKELRRGLVPPGETTSNHVVLLVPDTGPATVEALGYVRGIRPAELLAIHPGAGAVPQDLVQRWRDLGGPQLDPLPVKGADVLGAMRGYLRLLPRESHDFVTVVVPETIGAGLPGYLLRGRSMVRLKAGLLREPNVVVTDVPVRLRGQDPIAVDARPLIPGRTVALVFVSAVHDATIRAVNYARSLGATETRAIYFDLDPEKAERIEIEWAERGIDVPLDVVEAPFRDLTAPILEEVRRITAREDSLASVVIPEFVVRKWRHLLLHNQNALFVKRLLLFEPRCVLSSVPFAVAGPK